MLSSCEFNLLGKTKKSSSLLRHLQKMIFLVIVLEIFYFLDTLQIAVVVGLKDPTKFIFHSWHVVI